MTQEQIGTIFCESSHAALPLHLYRLELRLLLDFRFTPFERPLQYTMDRIGQDWAKYPSIWPVQTTQSSKRNSLWWRCVQDHLFEAISIHGLEMVERVSKPQADGLTTHCHFLRTRTWNALVGKHRLLIEMMHSPPGLRTLPISLKISSGLFK